MLLGWFDFEQDLNERIESQDPSLAEIVARRERDFVNPDVWSIARLEQAVAPSIAVGRAVG